jgi:hypothetical protein
MRAAPALLATVALASACATEVRTLAPEAESWGMRIGPLRVVPPGPGECVGRFEVEVVNGGTAAKGVDLENFRVLQRGAAWDDPLFNDLQIGSDGPPLATFPAAIGRVLLRPGESCVLAKLAVRLPERPPRRVAIQGLVQSSGISSNRFFTTDGWGSLTTAAVEVDASAWPLPAPLTAEAFDTVRASGSGPRISFAEAAMPSGGVWFLVIEPDGRATGWGFGRGFGVGPTRFRAGTLTASQRSALDLALRAGRFEAFRADPRWLDYHDGDRICLVVAAGPAGFTAFTMVEDFRAAGLEPLLDHLRAILRELPAVDPR